MNYVIAIIILAVLYGFYFLLTEGKPVKMHHFKKQAVKDFNKRHKAGFYNKGET